MRAGVALFCFMLVFAADAAAAQTLVYRVDRATAVIHGRYLVVTAKGAVRSGGWQNGRLVVRRIPASRPRALELAFVANPPGEHAVVVQSVMPMTVRLKTNLPRSGVATVKIVSETNSVAAQIARRPQRTALGFNTGN